MYLPMRIDNELVKAIDMQIARHNRRKNAEPITRSSWIRDAIRERLTHLRRAKNARERRKASNAEPKPTTAMDTADMMA